MDDDGHDDDDENNNVVVADGCDDGDMLLIDMRMPGDVSDHRVKKNGKRGNERIILMFQILHSKPSS